MFRISRIHVALILAAGFAVGCGSAGPPPTAKASGKVTLGGQPVTEGTIYFMAADKGFSASSPLDADGKYKIESALPPAMYKIYFAGPKMTKPPMPGQPPPETKPFAVPAKYQSEATSGLSKEIKAGDNPYDITLE